MVQKIEIVSLFRKLNFTLIRSAGQSIIHSAWYLLEKSINKLSQRKPYL